MQNIGHLTKMKVGLNFPDRGISGINLSNPDQGNPGVGGTQYCFLLLAYYLQSYYDDVEICVITKEFLNLRPQWKQRVVEKDEDLIDISRELDVIITRVSPDPAFFTLTSVLQCPVITWAHNYIYADTARRISNCDNIIANVFVSKQMYDFYMDDDIIEKSVSIFNIVPDPVGECNRIPSKHTLTFMGNISKEKGFLRLMKIWRKVECKYPDAQLCIIGGSGLYNRNSKVGSLGISSPGFEKKISPYILDDNGNIKTNIHFLGILGKEKYDVFLKSSVGIVNPTARTETFGMGIIEMGCAKLPVVTMNWNGHPDTALNRRTALLGFTCRGIANRIIRLFKNEKLNRRLGDNAKLHVAEFSPKMIIPQWRNLIKGVSQGTKKFRFIGMSKPYSNNYKFIRAFSRFLRFKLGFRFLPSVVRMETTAYFALNQLKKRITAISAR